MKKFRFRLQKVMEFKEDLEKQRMLVLGEAKKRVQIEEEKLRNLQHQDRECRNRVSKKGMENRISPVEMNLHYRYLKGLEDRMELQGDRIKKAEEEAEKKRQDLLVVTKERKILEKLKEKRLAIYTSELSKKEQFLLDDLASTNYIRRRMEQ